MKCRHILRVGLFIVINAVLLLGISDTISQAQSSQIATPNVQIAFIPLVDFAEHIYISNLDGTDYRQLTYARRNFNVRWSPDGRYVVSPAYSYEDRKIEIYLTDVDSGVSTQLTLDAENTNIPIWSPDSNHIAYTRGEPSHLCIIQVESSHEVCPGNDLEAYSFSTFASWSPDGQQIAFPIGCCHENTDIGVVNADGSNLRYITDLQSVENSGEFPKWSPEGQHVLFTSGREGEREIIVVDTDDSSIINLSDLEADDYHPNWSPDGTQIVFASNRTGDAQVYRVNVDGSNLTQLTDIASDNEHSNIADSLFPVWSPDGTRIALEFQGDLYVMNTDGTNLALLAEHDVLSFEGSGVSQTRWLPNSSGLIFTFSYRSSAADLSGTWDIRWIDLACLENINGCTAEDIFTVPNSLHAHDFDIYPSTTSAIP